MTRLKAVFTDGDDGAGNVIMATFDYGTKGCRIENNFGIDNERVCVGN